jgi:hypothetical protein
VTDPLKVSCPACGAKAGEACELATGLPRTVPHQERLLTEEELKEEITHRLRAELKAIAEWGCVTTVLRTQTEKDAVVIREIRRQVIEALLLESATRN